MNRATTILFWFSLALFVSLGLYHTSYRVEELGRTLKGLNTQISGEQRTLHVLKAEWVYLSNPARLEAAAKKHLALAPTVPTQITKMAQLAMIAPTKAEAMGTTTVAAAPVAHLNMRGTAAHRLKSTGEEKNRLNTRMVIGNKTAAGEGYSVEDRVSLQKAAYTLATSGDAP